MKFRSARGSPRREPFANRFTPAGPGGFVGPRLPRPTPPSHYADLTFGGLNVPPPVVPSSQIVLIPLFLKYWTSDPLSAWLTIFAAGSLVLAADGGLHAWSLNRFLSFKSRNDCDRRTTRYYGAVFQLFVWFTTLLALLLLVIFGLVSPSSVFGFSAEPGFDIAFAAMTLGVVFTLPMNLACSLYRARRLYGRIVAARAWGTPIGQLGQIVVIIATGSLSVFALPYFATHI